ncbi:hypothetical protein ABZ712_31705 [Streptomyces sp. NPDC006906]|uniref:hypothetical protein n=1 Tax=unclassified Streptomyces TaxID=2593676 RepID=UPI00340E09FC
MFPAPSTATATANSHNGVSATPSARTVMTAAWATSAQTMILRRVVPADSTPVASPAVNPANSRSAIIAPTPNAVPVTS